MIQHNFVIFKSRFSFGHLKDQPMLSKRRWQQFLQVVGWHDQAAPHFKMMYFMAKMKRKSGGVFFLKSNLVKESK